MPLAETFMDEGFNVIEVVLRTPNALEAIQEITQNTPCIVGAGSIVSIDDALKAKEAGASFGVSPGSTPELIDTCIELNLPYLPGAVTASEMMKLATQGIALMKFFPAEPAGGIPYLNSIMGPLPQLRFCPTGGVNEKNFIHYLNLDNVACVGGSWIAPTNLIDTENWDEISARVKKSKALLAEN